MHASLRKELEVRHSLLNLSVYNLVEEFTRHSVYAVFKYLTSSSNLSITIRYRVSSLIYTKQAHLYADKYSKKHLKVCKADALKIAVAYITLIRLELEAQLRKASEEEELAKTKKEKREKELTTIYSANKQTRMRDSLFARKNKVVAIDPANSILCDLSNPLVIRFCIFSNSALENIGILINKKVVEMQTNTATALANKLAAVNKLVRLQIFILKILEHIEIFALVCSFKKVDRHVFRANNTISVIAQQTITRTIFNKFYNCKLKSIIIAKFYKDLRKYN
ncbi:hypothetical protein HBI17_246950 [Parastagonospora nodorum]|nr:hypothetical protein HBI17_246950 [Parastagonospora nodorum]